MSSMAFIKRLEEAGKYAREHRLFIEIEENGFHLIRPHAVNARTLHAMVSYLEVDRMLTLNPLIKAMEKMLEVPK